MFEFQWQAPGFLHVIVRGLWSDTDADDYVAGLSAKAAEIRRIYGSARVLVDGRESLVQPASVMAKMAGIQAILICVPNDRAAYVVRSALGKLQAQRLSTTDQLQVFLSAEEAQQWLLS
ncbi:hypothetical protein [Sphingobium sp.]|uniref:hypothetical protein n=1 Tax=Sphingobium sp. TaxID=1912891 RepID=UPI0035C726CB